MTDLPNHLEYCIFDNIKLPENIKNYIQFSDKGETNNENLLDNNDDDDPANKYLGFNKNSSLKARLFNKNQNLIINAVNGSADYKNNSIFNMIGSQEDLMKHILNDQTMENDINLYSEENKNENTLEKNNLFLKEFDNEKNSNSLKSFKYSDEEKREKNLNENLFYINKIKNEEENNDDNNKQTEDLIDINSYSITNKIIFLKVIREIL